MTKKNRLESIETLRERQRDAAAALVNEVRRAIEIVDERVHSNQQEIAAMNKEQQQVSQGSISIRDLTEIQRYQLVLLGQIQHLQGQRATLLEEQNRRESVLLKAQQALKSLQKLQEQYRQEAFALDAARLQGRLDEWSNTRTVLEGPHSS
jgi:flagellar export protein FliJ